jgi:GNAT superfamily N-acetyltransferase
VDEFVKRLLRDNNPQRAQFGNGRIWTYRDPHGNLVSFGTHDLHYECQEFTEGKLHPYIPLLPVNPTINSFGYGTSIVRHFIAESALLALWGMCYDVLFLDVYTSNEKAIRVYTNCGFRTITAEPIADPRGVFLGFRTKRLLRRVDEYLIILKQVKAVIENKWRGRHQR